MSEARLTEELAKVVWDPERARAVALAAGFRPGSIPVLRRPETFWSGILEDARNGAIHGRVQAVADAAASGKSVSGQRDLSSFVAIDPRSAGEPLVPRRMLSERGLWSDKLAIVVPGLKSQAVVTRSRTCAIIDAMDTGRGRLPS